jgi:alkylation response protein AidB-like acyl-CoA dehydrogenase
MDMGISQHEVQSFLDGGHSLPWALDEEHRDWQGVVRAFAREVVEPGAAQRAAEHKFDPDLCREAGKLGIFGLLAPSDYGGSGADLRTLCVTVEEAAAVDVSFAATVHVQAVSVALLAHLASDRPELMSEVMPEAARGDAFVAFGLTESSGGSDTRSMRTRAVRDGSDWIISGSKEFISNSGTPFSRYMILFAVTGVTEDGRTEISTFLVPLDAKGVTVGKDYDKLGWRSADTHPVYLDEVRVPSSALLGRPGEGLRAALSFLTWARIAVAAVGTGVTRGCLRHALDLVRHREVFGRPLTEFQNTGFRLADLVSLASVGRLLTYDAAWKRDHGLPIEREAATAKLVSSEAANEAAAIATQLGGGHGVVGGGIAARAHQDARILTIVEGTSEIQRLLIARSLGLASGDGA